MSGRRCLVLDSTSSFTRSQPPASRARRSVRTASSPVKQPAVFGRKVNRSGFTWSTSMGWLGSDRFTRRRATVTISAPAASAAAAFWAQSLYLPVPTISRERKLRPATLQLYSAWTDPSMSAASDEVHDLNAVAVDEPRLPIGRPRHDLQVALDRDLAPVQTEHRNQRREVTQRRKCPRFSIDGQLHLPASPRQACGPSARPVQVGGIDGGAECRNRSMC